MADPIQTIILCGGQGTRMREETEYRPKPMVEIGGRPILWHIMKIYASGGFRDFVICLGYKGEMIKEYFLNYEAMNNDLTIDLGKRGSVLYHGTHEDDWRVTLADTGLNTTTAGRVKLVEPYVKGRTFMLTYGDGLANVDVRALVEFHRRSGTIGTVTGVRPTSRFGELLTDGDRVQRFSEKPQTSEGWINGGFFVLEREFFDYLSLSPECVLERDPLERLAREGQLSVFHHEQFWQCMDTYRDYIHLNELWASGQARWKVW